MVFLADEIGKELRRIVEFLNEQMCPAEVLAVEVVQYVSPDGVRTLVPTFVGATERAQSAKAVVQAKDAIDEPAWLASVEDLKGRAAREGAEKAIGWMRGHGIAVSITASQDSMSTQTYPFLLRRSTGNLEIWLSRLKNAPHYLDDASRLEVLRSVKAMLPGVKMATTKATGMPFVPLAALLQPEVWVPLERLMSEILRNLSVGQTL